MLHFEIYVLLQDGLFLPAIHRPHSLTLARHFAGKRDCQIRHILRRLVDSLACLDIAERSVNFAIVAFPHGPSDMYVHAYFEALGSPNRVHEPEVRRLDSASLVRYRVDRRNPALSQPGNARLFVKHFRRIDLFKTLPQPRMQDGGLYLPIQSVRGNRVEVSLPTRTMEQLAAQATVVLGDSLGNQIFRANDSLECQMIPVVGLRLPPRHGDQFPGGGENRVRSQKLIRLTQGALGHLGVEFHGAQDLDQANLLLILR